MVKSDVSSQKRVRAADPFVRQLGHLDVAVVVQQPAAAHASSATVSLLPVGDESGRLRIRLLIPRSCNPLIKLQMRWWPGTEER